MEIKLLFLLIFFISCGKEVQFKPNKLENSSILKDGKSASYEKSATLNTSNNTVLYQSSTYKISVFSSHSSLQFINSQSANTQVQIIFTGGIKGDEIVFENIRIEP